MTANRSIKSDETMFAIINQVREMNGAGVTELADQLGMSKGSVHHHLNTMLDHGYIAKEDGEYYLGLEFFAVGTDARERYQLFRAAKPELKRLAERTGEAAWSFIEENGKGMFLDGYAEHTSMDQNSVIGSWKYLHNGATGKAILAHLPEERVEQIIDTRGLPPVTEHTITDRAELLEELSQVRDQGYALNFKEDVEGLHAVGVPVFDDSELVGAIGTGGAASRLTRSYCEEELVPEILTTANEIHLNLVY